MNTIIIISLVMGLIILLLIFMILKRIIKQNTKMELKFESIQNESNRIEVIANSLKNIIEAVDNLRGKINKLKQNKFSPISKFMKIEIENEKIGILEKLDLLRTTILPMGREVDPNTAGIIEKFEIEYIDFKDRMFKSKSKLKKKIMKPAIESQLNIIQRAVNAIRLECWKLNVTHQLQKILLDHKQYLEHENRKLNDLIEMDLKEGFLQIKNRENKDFEVMKNIIMSFIADFKFLKEKTQEQLDRFNNDNEKFENITGQVQNKIPEFEKLRSGFSEEHIKLSERINNFSDCNNNLDTYLKKLKEFQASFEKLTENQNMGYSQNNNNLRILASEMSKTKSNFEELNGTFEGLAAAISGDTKNLSRIIDNSETIMNKIKSSEASYENLITNSLEELKSQMKVLEYKIKQIEDLPDKIVQYFATEKFIKDIDDIIDKKNILKKKLDYIISFVRKKSYFGKMQEDTLWEHMTRTMDAPLFFDTYRFIAIDFFKDIKKYGELYQDKWYLRQWNLFLEQLDSLIPLFTFYDNKSFIDLYLDDKPEGFNLKDLKVDDLKKIINQHHWVQIWEPLIRWAYFFEVYLGEDSKYLIEIHQHYAKRIEKLFKESFGYRIELYSPLEMIPKSLVATEQVQEVSDHIVFYEEILPHIKCMEKLKSASERLDDNPDKKLIVYVDQIGLLDGNKRVREPKLLFYSPLLMKHD